MAEENKVGGNNAVTATPKDDLMAKLSSEVQDLEKQIIAESSSQTANPEVQPQIQDETTQTPEIKQEVAPQAKPPDADNIEVPKQFKDKDGNADLDKIEKSSEHLRNKNEEVKQALERYKALQAEMSKGTQELRKVEREVPVQQPIAAVNTPIPTEPPPVSVRGPYPEELKQKIALDLESDPVGTILSLIETGSRHVVSNDPDIIETRREREARAQRAFLSEVDSVAKDGNDWVLTEEGFNKIQKVFQDRPHLKQGSTPIRDALRFIDDVPGKGSAPGQAQVGPKTPILGGGSAIPHPSLKPAVSIADDLKALEKQMDEAVAEGNFVKQASIEKRMNKLAANLFIGKV